MGEKVARTLEAIRATSLKSRRQDEWLNQWGMAAARRETKNASVLGFYNIEESIFRFEDADFDTTDQRTGLQPSSSKVPGGLYHKELARSSIIL